MIPDKNNSPITYFAQTDSRGRRTPFGIRAPDRSRHMYTIGKTGMGKSTLLENMAIQDIKNGNGLCFVDPHGKTADLLLDYVPEGRIKDVLYFAPFDMEHPVAFNIMEDVGADKRHLVTNGLMSTFEKIWEDAWSARMAYILNNTLLALLEYPGSTLLGVNRMLADKEYRKLVVANIADPSVRSFWVDEFAKYTDRYTQEAIPAIQNKVGQFTANPLIRNIVGQTMSSFNLRQMMDEKKIVIMNLSKGKVGEGNANLLGSMLITKIYLAAMSRADATATELHALPDLYLFVDEFQSFANKSFTDILSEARKYKLNLTLAHQYIEQMEEEVRAAVFGNVGTMAVFRVGAFDAEVLEKEFAPAITAEDLVNLGIYQIYLKLMINGVTSAPFSATTLAPIAPQPVSFREEILKYSRDTYARPRSVVEEEIKAWHAPVLSSEKLARAHAPIAPPPKERKELPAHNVTLASSSEHSVSSHPFKSSPRVPSPWHETSRYAPSAPLVSPARSGQPVSLSTLRSSVRKEQRGNGKHLSELRHALSEVLQKSGQKSPSAASAPTALGAAPADSRNSQFPRPQSSQTDDSGVKEIPEEMLRKLLTVEDKNGSERPIENKR